MRGKGSLIDAELGSLFYTGIYFKSRRALGAQVLGPTQGLSKLARKKKEEKRWDARQRAVQIGAQKKEEKRNALVHW